MKYLPNEVVLSTKVTNKFSLIKQKTGITPNIMARVAILKALELNPKPINLELPESLHQKIPIDVAFGEYQDVFDFGIKVYLPRPPCSVFSIYPLPYYFDFSLTETFSKLREVIS